VGLVGLEGLEGKRVDASTPEGFNEGLEGVLSTGVSKVILTRVGEGPVKAEKHLVPPRRVMYIC